MVKSWRCKFQFSEMLKNLFYQVLLFRDMGMSAQIFEEKAKLQSNSYIVYTIKASA